jgi:hypothetical protein
VQHGAQAPDGNRCFFLFVFSAAYLLENAESRPFGRELSVFYDIFNTDWRLVGRLSVC